MSDLHPTLGRPRSIVDTLPRFPERDETGDFLNRTYVRCDTPTPAGTPVLAGGQTILVVTDADAARQLCRLSDELGTFLAHGQLDNGDLAFSIGIDAAFELEHILRDVGITLVPPPA